MFDINTAASSHADFVVFKTFSNKIVAITLPIVPLSEALQPTAQAQTLCQTGSCDALQSDRISGLTS